MWPTAVLRGDDGFIFIGERCSVQDGAVLHTTAVFPTTVGNEVTIGHLAHLEGCIVEDKALIGSGSIVLHNAHIGAEAVVGGAAFVRNNQVVPPLAMALGRPGGDQGERRASRALRHGCRVLREAGPTGTAGSSVESTETSAGGAAESRAIDGSDHPCGPRTGCGTLGR